MIVNTGQTRETPRKTKDSLSLIAKATLVTVQKPNDEV
jgi:hypothetical protein